MNDRRACRKGHLELQKLFIQNGADINVPLAVAASKADFKIMKSLLENGADVYLVHFIPLYTTLYRTHIYISTFSLAWLVCLH